MAAVEDVRALEKRERGYLTPVTHWRASAVLITGGTQPGAAEGRGFQMERRANTLFRNATRCPPHPPTHLGTTWRAFVEVVVKLEAEASWENGYIQLQLPKKKKKKENTKLANSLPLQYVIRGKHIALLCQINSLKFGTINALF